MELTSKAFDAGQEIPARYTCDGEDISPPLKWRNVPREVESLALVLDDPDSPSGRWSHWVVYDIPPEVRELDEDVPPEGRLPWGGSQGRNDFGELGYGGPCPGGGETHRYYFRLYALDAPCKLAMGATRAQLLEWAHDHTLAETELMGRFRRGREALSRRQE
jgi:Raf kinase inhibitor-like YbhB/YbcL family protein